MLLIPFSGETLWLHLLSEIEAFQWQIDVILWVGGTAAADLFYLSFDTGIPEGNPYLSLSYSHGT